MLYKLRHIKRKLLPVFAMLAAALTSCINDDSLCPAEVDGEEQITLEFTVVTRDASQHGTRSLQYPQDYNPLKGTVAENFLDLRNTVFMLFDESQELIKVFKPEVTPDIESGYAIYSVKAFISASEFETLTGGKTSGNIVFSIAVVGNFSRLNPENAAYHIGQKLNEIFAQTTVATFEMPLRNNNYYAWLPLHQGNSYTDAAGEQITDLTEAFIPMAGIQTYDIPIKRIKESTVQDPLKLSAAQDGSGDINMLRALAKIEVVDRIDFGSVTPNIQPDHNNRTWIEKVELVGHSNRGSLFPTFSQWNLNNTLETQYVTTPSWITSFGYIGANPSDGNLTVTNGAALVNFFADATATAAREDHCRVFSCYLTEYNPNLLPVGDPRMWIRITAQGPIQEGTEPTDNTSLPYRLDVAPYTDGAPGASMPILRNNIYRYEITGLRTDVELKLIVDDWTAVEPTVWTYTDNPALANDGALEWNVSEEYVNRTNATVICSYGTDLTATFTFDEPKGGTWTAQLLPANNNTANDAFVFIDADGNQVETISGTITGAEAKITVKAKYEALADYTREARLIFTVLTPDGRTISANALGDEYGDNKFFTVIQNASL